jgi:hypothetical protein
LLFIIHAVAMVQAAEALGKLAYSFDARQELQATPPASAAEYPRVLSSTCPVLAGSTRQRAPCVGAAATAMRALPARSIHAGSRASATHIYPYLHL